MCKTWAINYVCGHSVAFRLSTCFGSYTVETKHKETRSTCTGCTSLDFSAMGFCGPCSRDEAERELDEDWDRRRLRLAVRARRASIDGNNGPSDDLLQAEEEHAKQKWVLGEGFPKCESKRLPSPQNRQKPASASRLRHELHPDDVVESKPAVNTLIYWAWDDAGNGPSDGEWPSSGDESDEDEEAAEDEDETGSNDDTDDDTFDHDEDASETLSAASSESTVPSDDSEASETAVDKAHETILANSIPSPRSLRLTATVGTKPNDLGSFLPNLVRLTIG